jgi:hypothetical protein
MLYRKPVPGTLEREQVHMQHPVLVASIDVRTTMSGPFDSNFEQVRTDTVSWYMVASVGAVERP